MRMPPLSAYCNSRRSAGQPRTAPRSGLRSDTDAHAPPATRTAHTTVSRRLILDATHHMNQLRWGATLGAVVGPSNLLQRPYHHLTHDHTGDLRFTRIRICTISCRHAGGGLTWAPTRSPRMHWLVGEIDTLAALALTRCRGRACSARAARGYGDINQRWRAERLSRYPGKGRAAPQRRGRPRRAPYMTCVPGRA